MLFTIADAYRAAGNNPKAIATLMEIAAHNVSAEHRTQLDNAKNLYRIAAGLQAAGDQADADAILPKAQSAAAALPADVVPELLARQLKAGDSQGAAASVTQLHARIAKAAASANQFEREMQTPNLRISEAEAHLAADDIDGAIAIVSSFASAVDRVKGYHRLADRMIDRAVPGIVGKIDAR